MMATASLPVAQPITENNAHMHTKQRDCEQARRFIANRAMEMRLCPVLHTQQRSVIYTVHAAKQTLSTIYTVVVIVSALTTRLK